MTEERSRRGRPQWAALVVGVLAIVLGAALITRPFSSLAVLTILIAAGFVVHGAGDLAAGDVAARGPTADRRVAQAIGLVWIVAGVGVLVWPGLTLRALSVFVGVALIVAGGTRIVSGVRADTDARWAAVLLGAAGIVLGIVSLGWPDMTILVVGVVFGIWLLAFGIGRLIEAIRGPESDGRHAERGQPRHRGWARTAGSAVALVMALAVGGLSVRLHAAEPVPDAFYDTPSTVPGEPGSLLRSESFNREVPTGAVAWRILYTTTRSDGSPAVASGLVVVPTAPITRPRPVIAWVHGTTGVDQSCAPSLLREPFESGALFTLDEVVAEGWALVATGLRRTGHGGPARVPRGPRGRPGGA